INYSLVTTSPLTFSFFSFTDPPPTEIYTLSLHDALPIWVEPLQAPQEVADAVGVLDVGGVDQHSQEQAAGVDGDVPLPAPDLLRSEEHTSELQSRSDLVCRLLLEKKK